MLTGIHPKLPMRNKFTTENYYIKLLGFEAVGQLNYNGYLMLQKDSFQLHFLNTGN